MRNSQNKKLVRSSLIIASALLTAGCSSPPTYRLVTHVPSGRMYYTLGDEIQVLQNTGQVRFPDHSRDATVTLKLKNAQVQEISKVRYDQAVTRISN
ncbi:MAG TPA: hypothetical protein ENJ06_05450 [Phycisphaeraceae bacterium]|nr:hypothetical protein [Phycisphaeraceae bacterium]